MEFKGIQLDLMEQVRVATYEFGVGKFPGLIQGRDLYEGRRRKEVDKQVRGKRRHPHPNDNLEAVHF